MIRLNRLFMSDGKAGIRRFARRARLYARRGIRGRVADPLPPRTRAGGRPRGLDALRSPGDAALARNPALVALSITNEVNLPLSENTSDGAYARARRGDRARCSRRPSGRSSRADRGDVELGFTYAYRYTPQEDADFWAEIGARATPRFRRALDHVGVQLYPGLFWPPVLITETAAEATLEALTLVRDCYMPKAGAR